MRTLLVREPLPEFGIAYLQEAQSWKSSLEINIMSFFNVLRSPRISNQC